MWQNAYDFVFRMTSIPHYIAYKGLCLLVLYMPFHIIYLKHHFHIINLKHFTNSRFCSILFFLRIYLISRIFCTYHSNFHQTTFVIRFLSALITRQIDFPFSYSVILDLWSILGTWYHWTLHPVTVHNSTEYDWGL